MRFGAKFRKPFPWFASASALVVLVLLFLCLKGAIRQRGVPEHLGWIAAPLGDRWVISEIAQDGPASGKLQIGDRLVSIDGSARAARFGPPLGLSARSSNYTIVVLRNGALISLRLPIWRAPEDTFTYASYFCLALLNFVIALWIAIARPDYAAAQIAFFLFLGMARSFAAASFDGFHPAMAAFTLSIALLAVSYCWESIAWAVAYDFAFRFPEELKQPLLLRLLRWFLYSAASLLFVLSLLPQVANLLNLQGRAALFPGWVPLASFDRLRPVFSDALGALALLSAPLVLARNYRRLPDAQARRRVRWAALGIGTAIVPIALGIAAVAVFRYLGYQRGFDTAESFLDNFASLFSVVAPITLAYAIVKHRVLGIAVVIRKGVQYLLAKNVLRLILWLPLIAIVIDLLLHPKAPLLDFVVHRSWWFYLLLIGSASLTLRFRNRLQIWVDRKFFRSAYEEEVILSELIDSMQACENTNEVARVVAETLQASLHPSYVTVLYRKEAVGLFTVGYPQDQPIGLEFRGILNERLQEALQTHRSARTFTEIASLLQDRDTASNNALLNTLLTPISGANGQLLGVLLLGEKKSEQSYSHRDRRLVQAVAAQMGLIFEMLSLKEQVREEGRVRIEVLGRLDQEHIQLVLECSACGACYTSPATHCAADGTALSLTLPIERIIDGKYRLERRIGTGGMGAVYEATDLRLDRMVAVKVMTGRLFGNTSALRRFEREARAAARLQHPGIVAIHDFGSLRGGGAYLVMQRIDGRSWRAEMARSGRIRPKRAAPWFDQLCNAVACAHSSGVIHRDLKPENLLVSLTNEGLERVTVLDFGVAKLRSFEDTPEPDLTSVDRVIGTYGYMSPEQRSGQNVDARSDIYSVAVIAVETLTNNRPPAAGPSREWLEEVLRWPQPTPVSDELVTLLAYALREPVKERPPTIYHLQHELVSLLYKCPPLLSTRAGGADSTDTETIPL